MGERSDSVSLVKARRNFEKTGKWPKVHALTFEEVAEGPAAAAAEEERWEQKHAQLAAKCKFLDTPSAQAQAWKPLDDQLSQEQAKLGAEWECLHTQRCLMREEMESLQAQEARKEAAAAAPASTLKKREPRAEAPEAATPDE